METPSKVTALAAKPPSQHDLLLRNEPSEPKLKAVEAARAGCSSGSELLTMKAALDKPPALTLHPLRESLARAGALDESSICAESSGPLESRGLGL